MAGRSSLRRSATQVPNPYTEPMPSTPSTTRTTESNAGAATREYVRPRDSASGDLDGVPWVINPRQIFDAEDQLVRAYPHLFQPVEPTSRPPDIQDTSAEPGRLRGQG